MFSFIYYTSYILVFVHMYISICIVHAGNRMYMKHAESLFDMDLQRSVYFPDGDCEIRSMF